MQVQLLLAGRGSVREGFKSLAGNPHVGSFQQLVSCLYPLVGKTWT